MENFDFKQDYVLENDIVQLCPLQKSDFDNLVNFAIKEPILWKYALTPADGPENMKNYINAALTDRKNETSYPFIVFDKRKNSYAGSSRFYGYQKVHSTAQLGYTWYGKDFQGTGLNKNCKYLMLEFAFEQLGLERVEFRADNTNHRSISAMKSIGCTVEGVLRNNCASTTARRDSIVLSILKNEWFDTIKTSLKQKCKTENERYNKV